jgi:hypothetical protein
MSTNLLRTSWPEPSLQRLPITCLKQLLAECRGAIHVVRAPCGYGFYSTLRVLAIIKSK